MNPLRKGIRKVRSTLRQYRRRWRNRNIPDIDASKREVFSIGIYTGRSPCDLKPATGVTNPVLTRDDVNDVPADLVADPFMIRAGDCWYMFFEVLNTRSKRGQIAVATSSDGLHWDYQRIVLDEAFHLSYPHVFLWEGDYYMIPETCGIECVRLYKAAAFPYEWEFVTNLLEGDHLADSSLLLHGDQWWLFASSGSPEQWYSADLRLFHADRLTGPWSEHPRSPVVRGDMRVARPAGRVRLVNGKIIRFAQDCSQLYGRQVRAFEITKLTGIHYQERPARRNPILGPSRSGWNSVGMHHIDAVPLGDGQWLACVDGWTLEDKPA